jgi:hypothetical protein
MRKWATSSAAITTMLRKNVEFASIQSISTRAWGTWIWM